MSDKAVATTRTALIGGGMARCLIGGLLKTGMAATDIHVAETRR